MKKIIFATFWVRLLYSTCLASFIVATVSAVAVLAAKDNWREAINSYSEYQNSGRKQHCENVFGTFINSPSAADCGSPFPDNQLPSAKFVDEVSKHLERFKKCERQFKEDREASIDALWESDCPKNESRFSWGSPRDRVPTLAELYPPGTLMQFTLDRHRTSFGNLIAANLAAIAYMMVSLSAIAALLKDSNPGWRRLIALLGLVFSLTFCFIGFSDYKASKPWTPLLIPLIVPLFIGVMMIMRNACLWVHAGFKSQSALASSAVKVEPNIIAREAKTVTTYQSASTPQIEAAPKEPAYSPVSVHQASVNAAGDAGDADFEDPPAFKVAGPWRRFVARTIDIWLLSTPVVVFVFMIFGKEIGDQPYIAVIVIMPFVILLEATIATIFGNTIGKAILAIRLTTIKGKPLTFQQLTQRSMNVLVSGMAFCIPLVTFFPMYMQYKNLIAGRPASYDQGQYLLSVTDEGIFRKILAGVFIFIVMLIPGCMREMFR